MNGAAISRVIKSGASAAQLGTAFLCCKESGIVDSYKRLILNQTVDNTVLTRSFSGKLARGINNKFIQCMAGKADSILDYPIQNKLTNSMRQKAKQNNNTDYMSLWAGQCAYLARDLDARSLIAELVNEMNVS
jgi:nitronate monooxygenase